MNVPSNKIGGFIVPLIAAVIGGTNNPFANRMNGKLVYNKIRQLVGKMIGTTIPYRIDVHRKCPIILESRIFGPIRSQVLQKSDLKICGSNYIQYL